MSEKEVPAVESKKTRNVIIITLLVLVSIHTVTWVIANLYPDNRVLADIYGRLGMDSELSFPTWFTSVLWFCFGVLSLAIARQQKVLASRRAWNILALVGIFASIDEVVALHELLLQGLHILADFGEGQTLLRNSWLLILPTILVAGAMLTKLLIKGLPQDTRRLLFRAFFVFFAGALIIEYVSIPFDKSLAIYTIGVVIIEEALEIIGVMLAISSVLFHIYHHEPSIQKNIKGIIN